MAFHAITVEVEQCVCLCGFSGLEQVESELITVVQHNGGISLMRLGKLTARNRDIS